VKKSQDAHKNVSEKNEAARVGQNKKKVTKKKKRKV